MATYQQAINSVAINRPISHSKKLIYRGAEIAIKQSLINEAVSFKGSTKPNPLVYTTIWSDGTYSVEFGKFGKEYYREKKPNKNDMAPTIFLNGSICNYDASFKAIFRLCEQLYKNNDTNSLTILGCLFVRNAFLVDHLKSKSNYKYQIPSDALDYLQKSIGNVAGIPIEVFLMYVDAIAWQEDVKYNTLGKPITSDVGRKNNMLTYARFIACLLGRSSFAEMLNKFSMGISNLPKKEIPSTFPELNTTY